MQIPSWQTPGWRGDFTALAAGVLLPLSLAPYHLWVLGLLATTVFAGLLKGLTPRKGFLRSFLFGLGMYGSGTSWVYISIYDFGNASMPLALAMTGIFVSFLALVFALPFYLYCKYLSRTAAGFVLGFASVWVLGEWIRSWFLTGFPWLYVGYAHLDTWLAGWAPVWGVFGVGWLAIVTGNGLAQLLYRLENSLLGRPITRPAVFALIGGVVLAWAAGAGLKSIEWVRPTKDKVTLAIVQPNIPMEMKWQPIYRPYILNTLRELSEKAWQADLVIWPEASIPMLYTDAGEFLYELQEKAMETNTAFVSGILYDDLEQQKYFNAILGLGHAKNIYFKQRLVPFGEYVPLEKYLRGLIDFFNLPNSIIHAGDGNQKNLATDHYNIAPYICYEVVYPDLVAKNLDDAALMVTISNDAWFGDSIGPLQHYQMAQMRALENGRYMIRATNTGLSGVISHRGQTLMQGKQFVPQTLTADIQLMTGHTPFTRFGSWPVILFCTLTCFGLPLLYRSQKAIR